jgi:hypothetical protein
VYEPGMNPTRRAMLPEMHKRNEQGYCRLCGQGQGLYPCDAILLYQEQQLLRATLIRSDSMLSLLRHRCEQTIPWGTTGMPETQDIDEIIRASRQALRATGPY